MLNKQKQQNVIDYSEIFLEVTNVCNFNCMFCVNDVMRRKRGFMDVDLFKRLVDEFSQSEKLEKILFHVMGEPTLHPYIIEMISYASKRTQRQILITNASTLQTEEKIRYIFESGLTNLDISYYCKNEEDFKKRGVKSLTFQDYLQIVKNIVATKYKYNYGTHLRLYLFNRSFSSEDKIFEKIPRLKDMREIEEHVNYWKKFIDELRIAYDLRDVEMTNDPVKITKENLTSGVPIFVTKDFEISIKPLHF